MGAQIAIELATLRKARVESPQIGGSSPQQSEGARHGGGKQSEGETHEGQERGLAQRAYEHAPALEGALPNMGALEGALPIMGALEGALLDAPTQQAVPASVQIGVPLGSPIVIGGAVMDLVASSAQGMPLLPRTSNPGQLQLSAGGVGRNIAEGLTRLGSPPLFLSAIGDDALGERCEPLRSPPRLCPPCCMAAA